MTDRRNRHNRPELARAALAVIGGLLVLSTLVIPARVGRACEELTVRDAAFAEPRDVHPLTLVGNPEDVAVREVQDRIAAWLIGSASGLNLEFQTVSGQEEGFDWPGKVGIPSAPPSSPATILAGRNLGDRRTFFVDYWLPGPSQEDLLWLQDSPARQTIRRLTPRKMAVVLHVLASGEEADSRITATLASVRELWNKQEPLGVEVLEVKRSDTAERSLISFLGVPEEGPSWVAVVFGKGKITPPLEGEEIDEAGLNGTLASLAAECTCLQTASSYGVDLPMLWTRAEEEAFVPMRTPEDTSPAAIAWAGVRPRALAPTAALLGLMAVLVITVSGFLLRRRASVL